MIYLVANKLVQILKDKSLRIAFAETITGGGLSKAIIEVPGASKVIDYSVVVYSNNSKIEQLGVKPSSLSRYGAVSEQVVYEMSIGLAKLSHADINVAISGISGPDGGTQEKPVGMMCVAINNNSNIKKITLHIDGMGRKEIIRNVIDTTIRLIIDTIN